MAPVRAFVARGALASGVGGGAIWGLSLHCGSDARHRSAPRAEPGPGGAGEAPVSRVAPLARVVLLFAVGALAGFLASAPFFPFRPPPPHFQEK